MNEEISVNLGLLLLIAWGPPVAGRVLAWGKMGSPGMLLFLFALLDESLLSLAFSLTYFFYVHYMLPNRHFRRLFSGKAEIQTFFNNL